MTTGLTEDMEEVLQPLRRMASRLSVAERFLVDKTCDEVIARCEEEEREAQGLINDFNELHDEMEDK